MKIDSMTLKNFRSHTDTTLQFSKINVVRGANGVGKSSIEQAIALALTNTCEGLTADGKGAQSLIRIGQEEAKVILRTSAGNRKVVITPKGKDAKNQDWTDNTPRAVLQCCTNTRFFLSMSVAEQSSLLARLVLPQSITLDDKTLAAINAVGLQVNLEQEPFKLIEVAYKAAYEMRRDVNRDLKEWRPVEYTPVEEGVSVEDIRNKLKERTDQLTERKAARSHLLSNQMVQNEIITRAQAQRETKVNRIREENQHLDAAKKGRLSKEKLAEYKKIAATKKQAQELDASISQSDGIIRNLEAHTRKIVDTFATIAVCPTCNQTVSEDALKSIVEPIEQNRNAQQEIRQGSIDARKSLGNWEEAQKQIALHEEAEASFKRSTERIRDLEEELKQIEIDAAKPTVTVDLTEIDNEIATLEKNIQTGMNKHAEAASNASRKEAAEKNTARKAAWFEKLAKLEYLIERFGPTGLKGELLEHYIGGFTLRMNETLNAFSYDARLEFDPYSFKVGKRDGTDGPVFNYLELSQLSKSQQFRFAIAFQVAVALQSGFNMVVIDETDMLDAEGRKSLMRTLVGLDDLEQAIILGTDERREFPQRAGVAGFYINADATIDDLSPAAQAA